MGINQDLFGTFAMKRGSVLGPFYQKLVLLRYFPKYGTFTSVRKLDPYPRSGNRTLRPKTGPFARVRKTGPLARVRKTGPFAGPFAMISLPSVSQMALV